MTSVFIWRFLPPGPRPGPAAGRPIGCVEEVVEEFRRKAGLQHRSIQLLEDDVAPECDLAPGERHRLGFGSCFERADTPAPDVRYRLLSGHPNAGEAGPARQGPQVGRREGVDVYLGLEVVGVPVRRSVSGLLAGRRCPDQQAPDRARRSAERLRERRQAVAVTRGLAAEDDPSARPEDPMELREGPVEVGYVVEDCVTEHEIEGGVLEGEVLGLADHRFDLDSQIGRSGREGVQHAGRDVGHRDPVEQALQGEVEREIAGAGPDLERVPERPGRVVPERLGHLRADLMLADRTEIDAPLRVVGLGRHVVVAGVGVLDLLWRVRGGCGHGGKR